MAFSTRLKSAINSGLNLFGLQLETLSAHRREVARLQHLRSTGYFDEPAFPVPESFVDATPDDLIDDLKRHSRRFADLSREEDNPVGFTFDNGFFTSPDAEVLYCIVRRHKPRRIVEVGSGNSTRISRLALIDEGLSSQLISIDPAPRSEIDGFSDCIYRESVEYVEDRSVFMDLGRDDVLFIDSSHELRAGNDLTHLYLNVLPMLASGVLVHIHDVFLPYDYRADWVLEHGLSYSEQYLVQAMLQSGADLEVIWAGYYLQRTLPNFAELFPHRDSRDAQSLWLRVR